MTTDVVTFGGGGPDIVVADDMPVPATMITFGVGGVDFTWDDPRVVDEAVRVNITGTVDCCTLDKA